MRPEALGTAQKPSASEQLRAHEGARNARPKARATPPSGRQARRETYDEPMWPKGVFLKKPQF